MARVSKPEIAASKSLYEIGYKYLCDNFHKFKETQKIRVAIAILQIFEKDDSKTPPAPMLINVEITHEDKAAPLAGNRISQYIEI